jgi:hypothetical protein
MQSPVEPSRGDGARGCTAPADQAASQRCACSPRCHPQAPHLNSCLLSQCVTLIRFFFGRIPVNRTRKCQQQKWKVVTGVTCSQLLFQRSIGGQRQALPATATGCMTLGYLVIRCASRVLNFGCKGSRCALVWCGSLLLCTDYTANPCMTM